jgi:hypothetical protein
MAAITSLAIGAAGSAYSAYEGARGARRAARAQERGYDAATAEQRRQYDEMMALTAPRRNIEGQALEQLAALTGLRGNGTGDGTGTPNYEAFYNSPDYQFALQQGQQAVERSAAAGGNLRSGNTLAAVNDYAQGRATQNFNQFTQRLAGLAGMGATDQAANAMIAQGDRTANNLVGGANARASGVAGAANQWQNFGNNVAQLGGYALQRWGSAPPTQPAVIPTRAGMPTGYGNQALLAGVS